MKCIYKLIVIAVLFCFIVLCIGLGFSYYEHMTSEDNRYELENTILKNNTEKINYSYKFDTQITENKSCFDNQYSLFFDHLNNYPKNNLENYSNSNDHFYAYPVSNLVKDENRIKPYFQYHKNKNIFQNHSTIKGYITNNNTNQPIEGAQVIVIGSNNQQDYGNFTYSNSFGFYNISIEFDSILLIIREKGYITKMVDIEDIEENQILWRNISLDFGASSKNSHIFGYITDEITDEPIDNAEIFVYTFDDQDNYDCNYTRAKADGFYDMQLVSGFFTILIFADGYIDDSSMYNIEEFETLQVDISLTPKPVENSIVYGYVTDEKNGNPIGNASVTLDWKGVDNNYWNYTFTDSSGYYCMNIASGQFALSFYKFGFFSVNTDDYYIDEDDSLQIDNELIAYPQESSIIQGYITNEVTDDPVENAHIFIIWGDEDNNYYSNKTYTDSSGFYQMNIAPGQFDLSFYKSGFFSLHPHDYYIDANDSLQIDFGLSPYPPENSLVYGYITNEETRDPLGNASIHLYWKDEQGHTYNNYTNTDSYGYYQKKVAAGQIKIYVNKGKYFDNTTDYYIINNFESLEINISLVSYPPENSLVYGYIIDEESGDPVENAYVKFGWFDDEDNYYENSSLTDFTGYYRMNVASGELEIYITKKGYFYYSNHDFVIDEFETLQIDVALDPMPAESSYVKGYITDEKTGEPIKNAYIALHWRNDLNQYYWKNTHTDSNGYYKMNIAAGEIYLSISKDDFFTESTDVFIIEDLETLQVDIALTSIPPENSVVHGYITDDETGEPIEGASVEINWRDDHNHYYWNTTHTDFTGYYNVNIAAGRFNLNIDKFGYFSQWTDYYNISNFEQMSLNVTIMATPIQNSVVQGYITNDITGEPIEDADISLHWGDDQKHSLRNSSYADASGFYQMNVAAGQVELRVSKDDFFTISTDTYSIEENDILIINIALVPYPSENCIIKGYITDVETGDPIEGANINLFWQDDQRHYINKNSHTDVSGFYQMNVAAGKVELRVSKDDFFTESTDDFVIGEFETLEVDVALTAIPSENCVIQGYITDEKTGEPIEGATVECYFRDDQYHRYDKDYVTNSSGYFKMNIIPGKFDVSIKKEGYFIYWSDFIIDEFETLEVDVALTAIPSENSVIQGYITDDETNDPIEGVTIELYWRDDLNHDYNNKTVTDSSGFYKMNVIKGEFDLFVRKDYYFDYRSYDYVIDEFETLQVDIALDPMPAESSYIKGYITDEKTGEPIEGAYIEVLWQDYRNHHYWNNTISDSSGFYKMNVASGRFRLYVYEEDYNSLNTRYRFMHENKIKWVNFSMEPEPLEIKIIKPKKGLYINEKRIIFLFTKTIIIGDINIEVLTSNAITRVEFYVDDDLKTIDYDYPFIWKWNEKSDLKYKHKIKVIGYDKFGNTIIDQIRAWKF